MAQKKLAAIFRTLFSSGFGASLPDPVDRIERLSRFLADQKQYSATRQQAKAAAFIPGPDGQVKDARKAIALDLAQASTLYLRPG